MNFTVYMIRRRRGAILIALSEAAANITIPADLLHKYLLAIGMKPTREDVEKDLHFLEELNLVQCGNSGGMSVAAITIRGRDVAANREQVPGIDVSEQPI